MRDFFIHPSQTNLDLYEQAIASDYSSSQCRMLADAYIFALRQVFPLARGSGKPFISHLVGTASLVMASGSSFDWVIAALLHALYQRRVPFQGGLTPTERRHVIRERFGTSVDDCVFRYTDFESQSLDQVPGNVDAYQADVLTIRLADELEDLCGHALVLHGTVGADDVGVRGAYPWRRDNKIAEASTLKRLSYELGLQGISRGFHHWLDFASTPELLTNMRTGWLSSTMIGV